MKASEKRISSALMREKRAIEREREGGRERVT